MTRYLLDTDIVSDLIRNPQGKVARKIKAVGESRICTSVIVACELKFGALKRGSEALESRLRTVLDLLEVLPFEASADDCYALIRCQLERAGTPVGGNDLLVAAHAMSLGLTVVTNNSAEFGRIQNLQSANWLAEN